MSSPTLTLLSRPGCHLCEEARGVVTSVLAEFAGVSLVELSIEDDAVLLERFTDEIPVVLINDRVHDVLGVDAARLRVALHEATI